MFIIGVAIGGSSRRRETLDTGTLDINNQDYIRKECTLEEVASEGILFRAGCLAVLS